MIADQVGVFRRNQPVDLRGRIPLTKLRQHRQRVYDVADRRGLDQQNPLERLVGDRWHGRGHNRRPACETRGVGGAEGVESREERVADHPPLPLPCSLLSSYAASRLADGPNGLRIFLVQAEKRCRRSSRSTILCSVTQLNWITRRGPENCLWP